MKPFPPLLLFVLAASPLWSPAAVAAESYDSCKGTITSLPATISAQGTWCLKTSLATAISSGPAIQVTTSNVTIDCNGFRLTGTVGAGTDTVGILALDRLSIGVRNCHLRGFKYGVHGSGSGFLVEGNRIEGSTQRGVLLSGDANVVRDNIIIDTGGSLVGNGNALGIDIYGDSDIGGNVVAGVIARAGSGQGVWGIRANDYGGPANVDVAGNSVRSLVADGVGVAIAVRSTATGRVAVRGNSLFGNGVGTGIQCATLTGAVRDNSVLGFATALKTCPDDGGNVVK